MPRLFPRGTVVLLAALVLVAGVLMRMASQQTVPVSKPQLPPPARAPAIQPRPDPGPAGPPDDAVTPFAADDKGFVGSNARCDAAQTAIAVARTPGSLVVICSDKTGRYGYRGVRLSDDAVLNTVARATPSHVFVAQNESVTYAVSPTELLVTAGEKVLKQEPMIE